jgi:hypothetical protein
LRAQCKLETGECLLCALNLDHDADTVVEDKAAQFQTEGLGVDKGAEAYALHDALHDDVKSLACCLV